MEKQGGDMCGVKVQETALAYGGAAWVHENVADGDGSQILEGTVIGTKQGTTVGRDRFLVLWETGHKEWLKLAQVRQLIPANQGKPDPTLPSSVRLLTAVTPLLQQLPLPRRWPMTKNLSSVLRRRRSHQPIRNPAEHRRTRLLSKVRLPLVALSTHYEISSHAHFRGVGCMSNF